MASLSLLTDWPISEVAQTVEPDAAQRVLFDTFRHATAQALDILGAACPTTLPSTPTGRMEAMQTRLSAMLPESWYQYWSSSTPTFA